MIGALLAAAWLSAARPVPDPARQEPAPAASAEVVATVQVHGNNATPDADVLAIAGVAPGDPFGPSTVSDVRRRLLASGKFEDVTVLQRYASIADPSRIAVVILVEEYPVRVEAAREPGGAPRIVRRGRLRNLMFWPILEAEDGYGVTYGARLAYVDAPDRASRLSFPLSWGGLKQAGVEIEHTFHAGPISRVQAGAAWTSRRNPAFEEDDGRRRAWGRIERVDGPVHVGGEIARERVSFADTRAWLTSAGADVTLDTRVDPAVPRNAVYARAFVTHLDVAGAPVDRWGFDGRGYIGVTGKTVIAARIAGEASDGPLPPYLKPLVGGWSSLRGFRAGTFVGDAEMHGSLEWRVPLSSPLRVAKTGVSVFADAGRAADFGRPLGDEPAHVGLGGGVWMAATVFRLDVSVAHGRGAGTRVNFGIDLGF